jgi:DNA-binding NarL/FixJ family response regulator
MEAMRVLLADDHALFRSGVAGLLRREADFEVVGEAEDGAEALERAKELMPDLILMDVYMPGMGGVEATRRIKAALPYVKIVMLTVSDDDKDVFEAIRAGAHGYLLKKIEPDAFFRTLRGVFRGEAPISRATATKILHEFARQNAQGTREARSPGGLSARELEVLELLTRGTTNKEIAAALGISSNTVKNHLKNILEKLHLENRVQAAAYALRGGLTPDR